MGHREKVTGDAVTKVMNQSAFKVANALTGLATGQTRRVVGGQSYISGHTHGHTHGHTYETGIHGGVRTVTGQSRVIDGSSVTLSGLAGNIVSSGTRVSHGHTHGENRVYQSSNVTTGSRVVQGSTVTTSGTRMISGAQVTSNVVSGGTRITGGSNVVRR